MARAALRTDDIKIEDADVITEEGEGRGGIVRADNSALDKEYQERMAFMEEPVTIEIGHGFGENPPTHYFCQVNGKNPELLINDQWFSLATPYLPVGERLTLKRKYVSVLAASKVTTVRTWHDEATVAYPRNGEHKNTAGTCNLMIIEDRNPRGPAWLAELRRRHF